MFSGFGDNKLNVTEPMHIPGVRNKKETKCVPVGVTPGETSHFNVKFCADFESVEIQSTRCLVFAQFQKEVKIAIISRQKVYFLAFFRYKTSALCKRVEVGQNTIAPRERAHKNTSRRTGAEVDNARRPGFAGAKIGENGRFGPVRGAFGALLAHADCDCSATTGPIQPILRRRSGRHTRQVVPYRHHARCFLGAEKVHFYAEKKLVFTLSHITLQREVLRRFGLRIWNQHVICSLV